MRPSGPRGAIRIRREALEAPSVAARKSLAGSAVVSMTGGPLSKVPRQLRIGTLGRLP